ncbi:MAG: nucleoside triphosphate pyrophosphatase [Chloroflexota bacterium]
MKEIILASASPRRIELLQKIGLRFRAEASDYREGKNLALKPHELVKYLSLQKARAVAAKHPDALVIAADTIGYLEGKVLGKPETEERAQVMLAAISGKTHAVISGLTIMDKGQARTLTRAVETKVTMKKLTKNEIASYVRTGEPLDKAGAYAIQGLGAILVKEIHGDYYNVVGLPLSVLAASLKRFGIRIL